MCTTGLGELMATREHKPEGQATEYSMPKHVHDIKIAVLLSRAIGAAALVRRDKKKIC